MFKVYQQWDKLDTCVVGDVYRPEFFSFIKDKHTRKILETVALETKEDLDQLVKFLNDKDVKTIRPIMPTTRVHGEYLAPPLTPRDFMVMIDDKLRYPAIANLHHAKAQYDKSNKDISWHDFVTKDSEIYQAKLDCYQNVFDLARQNNTKVIGDDIDFMNSAFIIRLGKDLIVGTQTELDNKDEIREYFKQDYPDKRIRIVDSEGHADCSMCPVAEGLLISRYDMTEYQDTFPDWEVVCVDPDVHMYHDPFATKLRTLDNDWFIPGFERTKDLVDTVDHYFNNWIGTVSESTFMVNILMLDSKNAVCASDNEKVRKAMARYGVELHVVPFRHKWFWDAGVHCVTQDINRLGDGPIDLFAKARY